MEETRKVGLLRAFFNSFRAFSEKNEKSERPDEFEDLKPKDFENAQVSEEEKKELNKTLATIKSATEKFYAAKKRKAKIGKDPLEEKYGEPEMGNPIYKQAMKINEIEEERKKAIEGKDRE